MTTEPFLPPGAVLAQQGDNGAQAPMPQVAAETTPAPVFQEPTSAPPAQAAQQPTFDLLSEFNSRFGSGFGSEEDIRQRLEMARQADEYKTRAESAPTFATPLAQRVNELIGGGASLAEVQRFMEMQSLDLAAISDAEIIRRGVTSQFPMFTPEEVQAYAESSLNIPGFGGDDSLSPLASANLKAKAVDFRSKMEAEKVAAATPPSFEAVRQQAAAAEANRTEWASNLRAVSEQSRVQKFELPEVAPGLNYALDYEPSQEAVVAAREQTAQYFSSLGKPIASVPAAEVQSFYQQMVLIADQQRFIAAVIRDVDADVRRRVVQEMSGPLPNRQHAQGVFGQPGSALPKHPSELFQRK